MCIKYIKTIQLTWNVVQLTDKYRGEYIDVQVPMADNILILKMLIFLAENQKSQTQKINFSSSPTSLLYKYSLVLCCYVIIYF